MQSAMQQELHVPIHGWFAQRDQFAMGPKFQRDNSIRGFQIASPSLIGLRSINSSFEMIERAGIAAIEKKAAAGTSMMITLFDNWLAVPDDIVQLEKWLEEAETIAHSYEFSDTEQIYIDKIIEIIYEEVNF